MYFTEFHTVNVSWWSWSYGNVDTKIIKVFNGRYRHIWYKLFRVFAYSIMFKVWMEVMCDSWAAPRMYLMKISQTIYKFFFLKMFLISTGSSSPLINLKKFTRLSAEFLIDCIACTLHTKYSDVDSNHLQFSVKTQQMLMIYGLLISKENKDWPKMPYQVQKWRMTLY